MSAVLLSVLVRLAGGDGSWTGTQSQLAAECGVCRRTLIRWLNAARDDQSITVAGKCGAKLVYAVSKVPQKSNMVTKPIATRPRKSHPASALAIMGAVFGTILGVGQSIRRGRKRDAIGQQYFDFETIRENSIEFAECSRKERSRLEKDAIAAQECKRRLRSIGSAENTDCFNRETVVSPRDSSPNNAAEIPSTAFSVEPIANVPFPEFSLPANTKPADFQNPAWIEKHVYKQCLKLGIVNESEFKHSFAIVGRVARTEKKTPAALLTFILRGGKRKMPWRADLAAVDWRFAADMVSRLPKESDSEPVAVPATVNRVAETEESRADNFEKNRSRWKNHLTQLIGSKR